ncbi:MAG: site-specific integrase [Clostridiales bacterium]|nr:site-specific integrase [Clostridiales bacterium]
MATAKKLPSGRWRCIIYIGKDENGKRKYKSITGDTKKEAEYAALEYANNAHIQAENANKLTFAQAAAAYVAQKDAVLSPSTVKEYRRLVKRGFNHFSDLFVNDIAQTEINDLVNSWAAEGLSPKTICNRHGFVSAVLGAYNPSLSIHTKLPQKIKTDFYIPDAEQIQRIYTFVNGTDFELPFLLTSQLGLRSSEIAGLQVQHIDFKNNTVTISQAMVAAENGTAIKPPKSFAGNREIPFGETVAAVLKKHCADKPPSDFVYPCNSNIITKRWQHILQKNDEQHFNFYALRHFFASQALLKGIPQRYIAELMGHSSEKMIETVYQHTFKNAKQNFANMMAKNSDSLLKKHQNATQNAT